MNATSGEIASSESEELILVDGDDRQTGSLRKARCHDGDGMLHRAENCPLTQRCVQRSG